MIMGGDQHAELNHSVAMSGYHPEAVSSALSEAIADERVVSYVLHHEPTFDRHEVRRHMTVLVLTPTRIILTHTDEHPGDAVLAEPYTSTTSESVPLARITAVVVTRIAAAHSQTLHEAVLTISWGTVSRLELEPAVCDDPDCTADHGYSGSIAGDDFTLRISAAADGGHAVERLLEFAKTLNRASASSRASV